MIMMVNIIGIAFSITLAITMSNASPFLGGTVKVGGADGGRVYGTYEQYDDGLGVAGFLPRQRWRSFLWSLQRGTRTGRAMIMIHMGILFTEGTIDQAIISNFDE